ncbi:hypothetical protein K439DRAFT_1632479, partial [Ramaria rubella]
MTALNGGFGIADAYDRYRARGVQYMEVMYDILTEHGSAICLSYEYNSDTQAVHKNVITWSYIHIFTMKPSMFV